MGIFLFLLEFVLMLLCFLLLLILFLVNGLIIFGEVYLFLFIDVVVENGGVWYSFVYLVDMFDLFFFGCFLCCVVGIWWLNVCLLVELVNG